MKLLAKPEAKSRIKREEESLMGSVSRLRKLERETQTRLQSAKSGYEPEKAKALKDYEDYIRDLSGKKAKFLRELQAVSKLIEDKKEMYYGLTEKFDELQEREFHLNEREKKLDLREQFINQLEAKWTTRKTA